jgi:hypothetical protein
MMTVPPLPPQSGITVQSELDCLTMTWAGRRGFIRRVLGLSGPKEKLTLYRDRLVYTVRLHDWMPPGPVMRVTFGAAHPVVAGGLSGALSFPRHTLADVRLERDEQAVRLTVQYRLSRVEIGATLGEADKAWLADVLRRWIAG